MYKLTENGVLRIADQTVIPNNVENRDWQDYQTWLSNGNEPEARFNENELKEIARKEIEAVRYEAEVFGVSIDGMTILSDRDTQMKLTSAALRAQRDPNYSLDWKCTDGVFVHLTGDEIVEIADLVGDYVQACYTRESQLLKLLDEDNFNEEELYSGWPSNVLTLNKEGA